MLCAAGRVRTDEVDGFKLDRGFQIFLTSYPEAEAALDYGSLQLQPFYAGAMVRHADRFHRVGPGFRFSQRVDAQRMCCQPVLAGMDWFAQLGDWFPLRKR